jgi:drug/metabolite transporter (DMT)-like permease
MSDRASTLHGIPLAAASALFLGLSPVFGKQAILAGMSPLAVVATRTAGAAGLLVLIMVIFQRRFFYIYPLGFVGCMIAGGLNGVGSLLYYSALGRIDASLGQLLYSLYPVFVAVLLYLDGHRYTPQTLLRLGLSVPAVLLLSWAPSGRVDLIGVGMMLGASLLYALHIPINQRVLYEAPAPTVTLYTLLAMTLTVVAALVVLDPHAAPAPAGALLPVLGLTAVTFLSRATLFAGVKRIGGLETSLIGLGELLVTLVVAGIWLNESLMSQQWIGALLLATILLMAMRRPRDPSQGTTGRGWLHWLLPPSAADVARQALLSQDLDLAKHDSPMEAETTKEG